VPRLRKQEEEEGPGDFSVDEKSRQVNLTEEGHQRAEDLLVEAGFLEVDQSLYDPANIVLMHHLYAGLRAHALFQRNVDYIVKDGEVVIVDEFTGRTMPGRRWSEGLHQAVEAKEGVPIQNENQTLASITFQNYFRLYGKLAGMTGTADTEAPEFHQIYGLEVLIIPTHMDMVRDDMADLVYLSKEEKFEAIIEDIKDCQQRLQPVLVGTTSIETSEYLSGLLGADKIEHQVLNAKQHAREAIIVRQAGRPGTVTIATNMAGRGTDIVLGGNVQAEIDELVDTEGEEAHSLRSEWEKSHGEVLNAGGLHIIGTERHESRRIDNQLRGRSGRQGDPGSSRFYLSLEDDLMRIFASERVASFMQKLGMEHGEAIEHPWVTKAIENAQRKVEARNFDMRKQLLEYDDVANDQRKEVYALRNELMATDDVFDRLEAMRDDVVHEVIDTYVPPQSLEEQWAVAELEQALEAEFGQTMPVQRWLDEEDALHEETLRARIVELVESSYKDKEQIVGPEIMRRFEKEVMLSILDSTWKEHLAAMDYLRQGIGLRGYAQKNPKQEYKREAFEMFQAMTGRIKSESVGLLSKVQVRAAEDVDAVEAERRRVRPVQAVHDEASVMAMAEAEAQAVAQTQAHLQAEPERAVASGGQTPVTVGGGPAPYVRSGRKIGRNEPCPCGSGKKYKQCHGRLS